MQFISSKKPLDTQAEEAYFGKPFVYIHKNTTSRNVIKVTKGKITTSPGYIGHKTSEPIDKLIEAIMSKPKRKVSRPKHPLRKIVQMYEGVPVYETLKS